MPENFQSEQGKVSSVEKKAGLLEGGKKKSEKLETELKAKRDVFFKQVTATEKVFAEADKLKYEDEKRVMNKDKTEIKDLLGKVAQNGEDILTKKEENPDLQTIRQSADRISAISSTVADNLAFFKSMELAETSYEAAKGSLDDAKKNDPKKDDNSRKLYKQGINDTLINLGELGAMGYLEPHKNVSNPDLKTFYTLGKERVDALFEEAADLQVKFTNEYEYDTDEKKEKMPPALKTLLDIKKGGAQDGPYGNGFDSLGRTMTVYKKSLESLSIPTYDNGVVKTEDDKKVTIKNARTSFMEVNKTADKISAALDGINPEDLPEEYKPILYQMKGAIPGFMKSSFDEIDKIDKGHVNVDSNAVLNETEKAYEGEPKKKYEAAIVEKDKIMKDPKFGDKLANYNSLATGLELKDDPEKNAKNPDVLNDSALSSAIEEGLTALAPLSGKLQSIDRSQLSPIDQPKFDKLKASLESKIQELMQVKLLLQNYHLAASIGERNKGEGKERPKYFNFVVKIVEGQQVIGMEPTAEFTKLSEIKQKEIMREFEAVPAAAAIDLQRKMKLSEDKDWDLGMKQFERGNWQQAKVTLLAYLNRFQSIPEKATQINATRGVLQGIMQKELGECKERLLMFEEEFDHGFSTDDLSRPQIMGSISEVWKNYAAAEKEAASGKYTTIEEVWAKVGKPKTYKVKAGGFEFLDPREQQNMLSEPDPEIRRGNILYLAKAANKAGLKSFAKMYYNMYFSEQIKSKRKSIDKEAVLAKFREENHDEEIDKAMKSAHEQERTKFITYINRTRGFNIVGIDEQNQKIFDKYDADYEAKDKNTIRAQIKAGMEEEAINKAVKQSLHSEMMSVPDGVSSNGSDEWKEAYGGRFNVVENIDDKFFVTESDIGTWALTYAIKFEALAAAVALGMLTGGAAAGFAAEMGVGAGVFGTGGIGFAVDGAVMHYTLTALTEGRDGFKDPLAFGKGLAMTYATMGLMKGTGGILTKVSKVGFVSKGLGVVSEVAEGSTAGSLGVGAMKLTGKSVLDATLLTGLSAATSPLINGKTLSIEELKHSFTDNFITCFVMGGMHGAIEAKPEVKASKVEAAPKGKEIKIEPKIEPKVEPKIEVKPEAPKQAEPPKPPETPKNPPNPGDKVQMIGSDGQLSNYTVLGIDAQGKVHVKSERSGGIRVLESINDFHSKMAEGNAKFESLPPIEKTYNNLATGKEKVDLTNPEHVEALKSKMSPEDFAVLQANPSVSPEVQASMIRGGVDLVQTTVNEKGETVSKTIRTYSGKELGQGAYGVVVEVTYVEKGSTQIKSGVMKNPHNTTEAKENFAHEGSAAKAILDLHSQYPELGAQHLIKPIFVSDTAIVYEKAMDGNGKTSNLEKGVTTMSSREWLLQFAGGVEGLGYMHDHGISHNDFKPGNVVVGATGGILIDIGSKVSVDEINSGKVQIRGHAANGAPLAHYVTEKGGVEKSDWVGQDPNYNNGHLLAASVKGELPLDVGDKFAVGRSIEFFLKSKGLMDPNGVLVPNAPPQASYLKNIANNLMSASYHPYEYVGNNPLNGRDPAYMSLSQAKGYIQQCAMLFP